MAARLSVYLYNSLASPGRWGNNPEQGMRFDAVREHGQHGIVLVLSCSPDVGALSPTGGLAVTLAPGPI